MSTYRKAQGYLGQVGAGKARKLMPGVVIVRAHMALDAAHHRQQLAREVGAHIGPQPRYLHIRGAPSIRCRLHRKNPRHLCRPQLGTPH